jgi:hypothetical protein
MCWIIYILLLFFHRIQQAKVRQELEEAANEVKFISPEKIAYEAPLVSFELPGKVHSKFVSW